MAGAGARRAQVQVRALLGCRGPTVLRPVPVPKHALEHLNHERVVCDLAGELPFLGGGRVVRGCPIVELRAYLGADS